MVSLISTLVAQLPVVTAPTTAFRLPIGASTDLTVSAQGATSYQWRRNGHDIAGATAPTFPIQNFQVGDAGIYSVVVRNASGGIESVPMIVGVASNLKVVGAGAEVGPDIVHQNGNIYDQVLLTGSAVTVTADPGQVTRISFIDLSEDIVQVEFSGSGTLTLLLDIASGPAPAVKYNQAVAYMRGHATLIIGGADQSTNISVFSVGRITAVNQALFRDSEAYDGRADISRLVINSSNGSFGGIRAANAVMLDVAGLTGIHAPQVNFTGPVYVSHILAFDNARPVLYLGGSADVRITGGNLAQDNGRAVEVHGITELNFVEGITSHGVALAAKPAQATLRDNGLDVSRTLLDSIPVATYRIPPAYPFAMRQAGISGDVLVDFLVETNGTVVNAYAFSSSRVEFSGPAVTAVSSWLFKPGRKDGRPVITHMQVPILFQING